MLVEGYGFVPALGQGANDDGGYMPASGSHVEGVGFVEDNDEKAVFLKLRALNERVDVGLEPGIGGTGRAVMCVAAKIGDDKGIVGEAAGFQIGGELSEGHKVLRLPGIVLHVSKIGGRIVADGVETDVVAGIADRGNIFGVRLPGFARGEEVADHVVSVDGKVARRDQVAERERPESLSGGELKIVRIRGMRVGEVVCRQAVLAGEAVQVGHRGISDYIGVAGVFLDDDEDMAEPHARTGRRRRGLRYLSSATGQGEDAKGSRQQSESDDRQSELR